MLKNVFFLIAIVPLDNFYFPIAYYFAGKEGVILEKVEKGNTVNLQDNRRFSWKHPS